MEKRGLWKGRVVLFLLVILIALFFLKSPSHITGGIVYEEITNEKNWTFATPTDYSYDSNFINLSSGEVKLIPEITTLTWTEELESDSLVTSSTLRNSGEDSHDKTIEVQTIDGEFVNLQKGNNVLDVSFDTALNNGDTVSIYILQGNNVQTDVYLCDESTVCDAPGYGLVNFDEEKGWYNITLSGLSEARNVFGIDPPNHIKIDYVKATYTETTEHSSTNTTYPSSAEIETSDFTPADLFQWGSFTSTEELNEQNINYQYSIDSGSSWEDIPGDGDLSSVDSSGIRLKAILTSDETGTPSLNEVSLDYITRICTEDWTVSYGNCLTNDSKLKYYLDGNSCGITDNLPADNGTYVECDYCTPSLINSSWSEWIDIGECRPNDLKRQQRTLIQSDNNSCGEIENLIFTEEQNVECDYCAIHNCSGSFENTISSGNEFILVDTENRTNIKLEINSSQLIGNSNITVVEYNWTSKTMPSEVTPIDKYLEIESDLNNISSAKIIIYYTNEEINVGNIDEETLKVNYYNETSGEWQELDSIVNTTGNYVYAIVSHFSLYGVFGEERSSTSSSSSSSSGSGGGGGGSSRRTVLVEEPQENLTTEAVFEAVIEETVSKKEIIAEKTCDYTLEISLPEKISLIKENSYQGEIINQGNCDIQRISLYVSPKLDPLIEFSPSVIKNLSQGGRNNFQLVRKTERKVDWFSFITGSAVVEKMISKEVSGTITLEGAENGESLFAGDLPIEIKIFSSEKVIRSVGTALPHLISFIVIFLVIFVLVKKRRNKQSNGN